MEMVLFLLMAVVALLAAFYAGIVVGIKDCKRRFKIPYGATGVNSEGVYYDN